MNNQITGKLCEHSYLEMVIMPCIGVNTLLLDALRHAQRMRVGNTIVTGTTTSNLHLLTNLPAQRVLPTTAVILRRPMTAATTEQLSLVCLHHCLSLLLIIVVPLIRP